MQRDGFAIHVDQLVPRHMQLRRGTAALAPGMTRRPGRDQQASREDEQGQRRHPKFHDE